MDKDLSKFDDEGNKLEKEESVPEANDSPDGEKTEAEKVQEILDLEGVDKFKFAGREWTPKDFQGAYMMQADYTRKTQALAEERKFYDNLESDLAAVKSNPQLAQQFKQVYPEKFHKFLGYVASEQPKGESKTGMDPQFIERFNKVESYLNEQTQKAIDSEIAANCDKMNKKYPDVQEVEELALGRLQRTLEERKQTDPNYKLTEKDWENAWKSVDQALSKVAKSKYSNQVNKQKDANAKGKDIGSGGGTPGQAPVVGRSIREQSKLLRESGALENI